MKGREKCVNFPSSLLRSLLRSLGRYILLSVIRLQCVALGVSDWLMVGWWYCHACQAQSSMSWWMKGWTNSDWAQPNQASVRQSGSSWLPSLPPLPRLSEEKYFDSKQKYFQGKNRNFLRLSHSSHSHSSLIMVFSYFSSVSTLTHGALLSDKQNWSFLRSKTH